jgi:hypothetical protein
MLKLLCRKLSISEVEVRVSEITDAPCKAIISNYPELGFDIDKLEDLKSMQKLVINN